jgi:hypothetical protein
VVSFRRTLFYFARTTFAGETDRASGSRLYSIVCFRLSLQPTVHIENPIQRSPAKCSIVTFRRLVSAASLPFS